MISISASRTAQRLVVGPLGLVALALGGIGSPSSAGATTMTRAHPASPAGNTIPIVLRDRATGFCLDGNTSGNVYALACNGGNFQHWTVPTGPSTTIRNVSTGFCLDSNNSVNVYATNCNGDHFQNWNVSPGNQVTIQNVSTGFCLDSNTSGNVYTGGCNGGNFQKWLVGG